MNDLLCALGDVLHRRIDRCHLRIDRIDLVHDAVELLADGVNRARADLHLLGARVHGIDGVRRIALDGGDALLDLIGGVARLLGELSDLLGDDGEAASCLARTCRLDGGVEREEICLLGDGGDGLDDLTDLLGALAEFLDDLRRALDALLDGGHFVHGVVHQGCALLGGVGGCGGLIGDGVGFCGHCPDVVRYLVDAVTRCGERRELLFRSRRDGGDRARDLRGGLCHLMCARRQLLGGGGKLLGGRCDLTDEAADVPDHRVEVRGEASELVVRVDGEVGEVQLSVGERIDVPCECLCRARDGRGKAEQEDDDADNEENTDHAEHPVGHLEALQLGKGDALWDGDGDDPARRGHGAVGDDLLLAVLLHREIAALFLNHLGKVRFEHGGVLGAFHGVSLGGGDDEPVGGGDDALALAVVL